MLASLMIIFQFYAAYSAFKIWKLINGKWGAMLPLGFLLMGIRRVIATYLSDYASMGLVPFLDKLVLPLIITVCICLGMRRIYKAAKREHYAKLNAESNLSKLRELTEKLDNGK